MKLSHALVLATGSLVAAQESTGGGLFSSITNAGMPTTSSWSRRRPALLTLTRRINHLQRHQRSKYVQSPLIRPPHSANTQQGSILNSVTGGSASSTGSNSASSTGSSSTGSGSSSGSSASSTSGSSSSSGGGIVGSATSAAGSAASSAASGSGAVETMVPGLLGLAGVAIAFL